MPESIENKVIKSLRAAEALYHRLVLLVGKSGSGKTSVLHNLAKQYDTELININLCLSKELLELTEKQRQLKLSEILEQTIKGKGNIVFLDNIEILFGVELKQDPLRLLQRLSRNISIVASWNGTFEKGKLNYAEPGHQEYRNYDLNNILLVSMSGEASIDTKESGEVI